MIGYSDWTETATSNDAIWGIWFDGDPVRAWLEPDMAWWENLLDFMWRLYLHLMPQDGAKRKPPRDAGRSRRESRAPMIPQDCHGPIHYWSGVY